MTLGQRLAHLALAHLALARLALAACLSAAVPAMAAAPPPVGADHAMVVSAHALATDVGVAILRQGGNVVDAAVAVGYALAVVYPAAGNLGGGGFMTLSFADGRTTFLDFREKAPGAATADMFLDASGNVVKGRSTDTWLAVGVPGSVAGLDEALRRYGSLPRERVMAPALRLAREGFTLREADLELFRVGREGLAADPAAAAIFLKDGQPLAAGDTLRQPQLAATLEAISRDGAKAVYGGPVGRAIVAASQAGGGILSPEDFAGYAVRELPTLDCSYRGYEVHSAPPPSSGGVTLCEMLGILEGYDLARMGFHSAAEVHVMTEAMRYAYHDRNTALGDPAFVQNPVARLIDKGYAARLRAMIAPDAAGPANPSTAAAERPQTTHYAVADAAGNAVSVTTTLNGWFGIRKVAGDTGILMNNEMDDFTSKRGTGNMFGLVQGAANAIAPGKTPLSSMSPTVVTKDGALVMVIGSPGGSRIITTVLETIVNVIDHGMTLSEAIDAPRFHMQGIPNSVALEPFALSPDTEAILTREGYAFTASAPWGVAAGILAGGAALAPREAETHALAMPQDAATPFRLYGAQDVRGPTGLAAGY